MMIWAGAFIPWWIAYNLIMGLLTNPRPPVEVNPTPHEKEQVWVRR